MKIIEVRDGFIKFEADEGIYLSSFIKVDGEDKSYLAQVIQQKGEISFAKILFVMSNGELLNYDKTEPSIDSDINDYTGEMLKISLSYEQPVIMGKTIDNNHNLTVDLSAFDKKTIVSLDEADSNNTIVKNLVKQFNNLGKKAVIIDTLGVIKATKSVAGVDFKLPLDKNSLKFMYEDCLSDATAESKSTIAEIFKDLAEYSETVPFVPFRTLKAIVDEMVEKSHIFKLLVLKNKLTKFEKLNYFATTQDEVHKLSQILNSNCSVIDLSGLDNLFLNRYLSYIYETLNGRNDIIVVLELSNSVSKKSLKQTLTSDIPAVFVTHSKFNYLNDIKNFFDNFVIVPSISNNQIFRIYSTFLKAIKNDSFLIAGEATNYIPFISKIQLIEDVEKYETEEVTEEIVETEEVIETPSVQEIDIEDEVSVPVDEIQEQNELTEESFEEEILAAQESDDEVINAIDAKSNATIAEVTENLEMPEDIEMFSDEEENDDSFDEETELDEISEESDEIIVDEIVENTDEQLTQDDEDELTENVNLEEYEEPDETSEIIELNEDNNEEPELEISDEIEESSDFEVLQENNVDEGLLEESEERISEEEPLEEENSFANEENDLTISDGDIEEPLPLETEDIQISEAEDIESGETEASDNSDVEEIGLSDIDIKLIESAYDETENTSEEEYTPEETTENDSEELIQQEVISSEEIDSEINEVSEINNDELDFEDIVELDPSEAGDNDIIVDLEDDFAESVDDNSEEQIVKDVDKVFTTMKEDNDISDSDLDFIDELNSDEDTLFEDASNDEAILEELAGTDDDGILQEEHEEFAEEEIKDYEPEILEKRDSSTPIVPVYDADIPQEDMVESDPIEQGDSVVHAKYGNGVVEKMIKYGNKTLFSINFENIGRRLLDPTLTEIKKQ